MDLRRLRAGEWMGGLAGLALLIALFLPWYGDAGADVSGWEAFSVTDVLLAITAVCAIALVIVTAAQRTAAVSIAYEGLLTLVALVATVAVVFRVLNLPDELSSREAGLWLGLAATLGVLAAATYAMRDERLSKPGRLTDTTGVPVDAQPEVETLPAPPREEATR